MSWIPAPTQSDWGSVGISDWGMTEEMSSLSISKQSLHHDDASIKMNNVMTIALRNSAQPLFPKQVILGFLIVALMTWLELPGPISISCSLPNFCHISVIKCLSYGVIDEVSVIWWSVEPQGLPAFVATQHSFDQLKQSITLTGFFG